MSQSTSEFWQELVDNTQTRLQLNVKQLRQERYKLLKLLNQDCYRQTQNIYGVSSDDVRPEIITTCVRIREIEDSISVLEYNATAPISPVLAKLCGK